MYVEKLKDGYAILANSTEVATQQKVSQLIGDPIPLIVCDPPYGKIVSEKWDNMINDPVQFADWMLSWTELWTASLVSGGAFYVWGGIGRPDFRPFFRYIIDVETKTDLKLANLITWSKKRAYGVKHNYLFTREECAYFVKGDIKKPRTFNIPLLETKRGYAGYNEKYPAKSEFYRRTNVWMDINEIFRGKLHPTQKTQRVMEIPIEVHTSSGEYVVDMFAGAGTTAHAARKLDRKFVVIENDKQIFEKLLSELKK